MARIRANNVESKINDILVENGIEGNQVSVFVGRGKREEDLFVKMFQKKQESEVLMSLHPSGVKLFCYVLLCMEYGNFIESDQSVMAQQTGLSLASIKRQIKELVKCGILIVTPDTNDKRRNTYYINPHTAWKGNPSDRARFIKQYEIVPPLIQTKLAFLDLPNEKPNKVP